jgi:holliday junction DNA helicase RuvA
LIGRLSGKLIEFDATFLLVDVAGVAYEVEVSAGVLQALPGLGGDVLLHTHFVVREDAQLLYGFASKSERDLFRAFIKISGVGPKLGLALISALDPNSLVNAVRNNDVSLLTKVPGVGKKTAERLMVELKSRLDALTQSGAVPVHVISVDGQGAVASAGLAASVAEAEGALIALGYKPLEAARAVATTLQTTPDQSLSAEELVRLTLRGFAQTKSVP